MRCNDCKNYEPTDDLEIANGSPWKNRGECRCIGAITAKENSPHYDIALVVDPGCAILIGPDFGCIHFERRNHGKAETI